MLYKRKNDPQAVRQKMVGPFSCIVSSGKKRTKSMVLSISVTADNPEYHPVLCRIGADEFEAVGMRSHRRQGVLARRVEDIGGNGVTGANKYIIGSLLI